MFSHPFRSHHPGLWAWFALACTPTESPGTAVLGTTGSTSTTESEEISPTEPTSSDPMASTTAATDTSTGTTSSSTSAAMDPLPGGECGDGTQNEGEACDLGMNNRNDGACKLDCTEAVCGDGFVWTDVEECDDASDNGKHYAGCSYTCEKNPYCGDSTVDLPFEQCDAGPANGTGMSDENTVPCTGGCRWDGRITFLSSALYYGDLGKDPDEELAPLDVADELCKGLAWEAGYQRWATFRAWLSDGKLGPLDRFAIIPARPILLPTGERIADSLSDLILNGPGDGIRVDEHGTPLPSSLVWTNTDILGEPASEEDPCDGWSSQSPDLDAQIGLSHLPHDPEDPWKQWQKDKEWTSFMGWKCGNQARLYCFEQ